MRLASKIFVTSSLVVAVLLAVGVLSLRALDRLVTVNRAITEQSVPALRKIAAVRDATLSLARLETRAVVLQDAQYAALWDERALPRRSRPTQTHRPPPGTTPEMNRTERSGCNEEYRALLMWTTSVVTSAASRPAARPPCEAPRGGWHRGVTTPGDIGA